MHETGRGWWKTGDNTHRKLNIGTLEIRQVQFGSLNVSSKILAFLAEQRENLLLWIPVFLGVGACLYFALPTEPFFPVTIFFILLASCALAGALHGLRKARQGDEDPSRNYLLVILASIFFWVAAGFAVSQIEARAVYTPMLASESKIAQIDGRVRNIEVTENSRGVIVILDDIKIEEWKEESTPRKIRLTIKTNGEQIALGDRISVLAKLHASTAPVMPLAFDFQRFYYFQGIGASGFSLREATILQRGDVNDAAFTLHRLRKAISTQLSAALDPRVSGIATALMTGERASISDKDWAALRASGLAHIISISGLHVVLVAAPVFFFIRLLLAAIPFIALRWPIKKIAAGVALAVCCAYVALVVPSVPTYRALIMTGIGLVAIMLDRSPFSLRLVALAATIVLLLSPDSIWSASFQMSFAAVIALVVMADVMRPYWSSYIRNGGWERKAIVYIAGAIMTTFVASVATAPFSSFHFQQIATYSVVANTLATPLSSFIIMPMIVLSFFLMPLGLAEYPIKFMGLGIKWMLDVAGDVASWPGASIHTPAWPLGALVLVVMGGLCLCLLIGRARLAAIPCFVLAFIVILSAQEPRIIVSADGGVVLVNQDRVALVSTKKREKFATEVWGRRVNAEEMKTWPREGQVDGEEMKISCDAGACRIITPRLKIATGADIYTLREDCEWADMVIVADKKMPKCSRALVYDRWKLRETGALAIMADGTIKTVREDQGERPWSTWPDARIDQLKSVITPVEEDTGESE
jgi:competence protein ComEC